MENDVSKVSEHVVQPGYTLWTVGYILRLDAAKQLLETHAEQHMWLGVDSRRLCALSCHYGQNFPVAAEDSLGRFLFRINGLWDGWTVQRTGCRMECADPPDHARAGFQSSPCHALCGVDV